MADPAWLADQAELSLSRLLPRLKPDFDAGEAELWEAFETRLHRHFPTLFARLYRLYGHQYDFFYHLEELLHRLAAGWRARPPRLRAVDARHERDPYWYESRHSVGAVCYVDLFAGTLAGLRARIPYLRELGISYLHLMPLLQCPPENNDGGYAVSSYRAVRADLGTMDELAELAEALREAGIALVLDFVFNHTADDHEWAQRAKAGERHYQKYYWLFEDRSWPDQYQRHLRDIFPDRGHGAFTWEPTLKKWVWTTFYSFQWDLNFSNPALFNQMAEEMLFLANRGVSVLRLDAVPFIWKRLGTTCENQPEAHAILQAYNAAARIAAPSLLFKSEAIVHPDEVARYVDPGECQLSYNPLVMVTIWNALATRKVDLLHQAVAERYRTPAGTAWVNYVRCHDDIGWGFADEDLARLGYNGHDHRQFLNRFYTGRFPGSFARGLPFQENPRTGDCRIAGMAASLAGLEKGLADDDPVEIDLAVRRLILIHGLILTLGGLPLLYLGDEVATLNDYSYRADPATAGDARWVHRPARNWQRQDAERRRPGSPAQRVFDGIKALVGLRKSLPALEGTDTQPIDSGSAHVLGFVRRHRGQRALVLANFSEQAQHLPAAQIRRHGEGTQFYDLHNERRHDVTGRSPLRLGPYRLAVLVRDAG